MQPLAQPIDVIRPHYDVVVVGSGYGGGVAASRLARCGRSVCVLERGREVPTGAFPARFPDIRRELQITGRLQMGSPTGLFEFRNGRHIHVLVGCGLGGGSLINAGVAMRPDARVFEDPAWPVAIMDPLLEKGFARAARMLRPATDPEANQRIKYQALERASTALGVPPRPAPVAVTFEETVNPAGVRQPACTLCGDCCAGCNVGAKNTIALTYLPDARAHGAHMFTGCAVRTVLRHGERRWRIDFEPSDARSASAPERRSVTADIVVLAAGTLGSTEILLRSREAGLALSDRLGERFSANGDIIAFGYGAKVPVNAIGVGHPPKADVPPVGACVAGQVELRDDANLDNSLYVQEGVMPSAVAPLLPVMFLPGGRLLGAAQSLIQGVYKGPFSRLHTFFVVSHDTAAGRMVLRDNTVAIDWPDVASQDVYARVDAVLEKTVAANGGKYVKNPLAGTMIGTVPATAHPLGGCATGEDAAAGVVDHKGRVFNGRVGNSVHDGLYVCDGSIMPRSLGVNPLLTIAALTERAMIHLARDRGWHFDEAPLAEREASSSHA